MLCFLCVSIGSSVGPVPTYNESSAATAVRDEQDIWVKILVSRCSFTMILEKSISSEHLDTHGELIKKYYA